MVFEGTWEGERMVFQPKGGIAFSCCVHMRTVLWIVNIELKDNAERPGPILMSRLIATRLKISCSV